MKRKLAYTFIGILILVVLLYLYRYKQGLIFTDKVPEDATAVINVNLRQLEHHILIDALKHPFTYFKADTTAHDTIKKKEFSLTKGLVIPKNILFFTNASNYKNNWFSSVVQVSDSKEFSNYLLSEKFEQYDHIFIKGKFVFILKNKQLIIAIGTNSKNDLLKITDVLFAETKFLKETEALFKTMIQSRNDFNFITTKGDILEGDFKDGLLKIQGKLNPDFDLFINNNQLEFDENSIASLSVTLNNKHILFQDFLEKSSPKFKKLTHLSLDSITKEWNGNLNLNLKAIETKTDTIITYEYDDNFNKIEKISTQTLAVPNLTFNLGVKEDVSIWNYLTQQHAIQIIERDTLFTSIPLYKFHTSIYKNFLRIYTHQQLEKVKTKKSKLSCYIDMDKYRKSKQKLSFVTDTDIPHFIKRTSVQLSSNNNLSILISSTDRNRNFLGQLLKSG